MSVRGYTMRWMAGLLACGVLVLGIVVWWSQSDLHRAAHAYLRLIPQGRYEEAYDSTAAAFRERTDKDVFISFISRTILTEYTRAIWETQEEDGSWARLDGVVKTRGGRRIPVALEFDQEDGTWKVRTLEIGDAGLVRIDDVVPIPSEEELAGLTDKAMQLLAHALNKRDFAAFYESLSQVWQNQTTPEELYRSFVFVMAQGIDLSSALEERPVFADAPEVDAAGVLTLDGHYPSETQPFSFSLKFVTEDDQWKLLGVNVRM